MKILITGATGFIGKNLINKLKLKNEIVALVRPSTDLTTLERNLEYYVFDGDIQKLITYLKMGKFDGIVHLASLFLAKHDADKVKELIETNVLFSTSILEAAVNAQVPWFINTGTFWQHYKNKDYSPVNLYAATKQAFQDIALFYAEIKSINFVTLKLSDTYGPGDTRPKIFNLWTKLSQSSESLDMSAGEQLIDISYIDDIVSGYVKLISLISRDTKHKLSGKSFAIRSKQVMKLKLLAKLFEKVSKKKLNINWGKREYRVREVMVPWTKGKLIPGWKPEVELSEGILKIINEK